MVSEGVVHCGSDGMVEQWRLLGWKHVLQAIHVNRQESKERIVFFSVNVLLFIMYSLMDK